MSAKAKVHVEYCAAWGYEPKFQFLKAMLQDEFGDDLEITGATGRLSSFEITVNGTLVFSKLENGNFPRSQATIELIKKAM